ncbi:hypothetical protein EN815_34440 [Mesorhizobium sp. M4B.F.Ca.ET.172.01.1.1]|nr:hypothetical protein EN815_34440 [Mesorhizobium sp. M4B.F.Ca.ET.172.01.1.1]
MDRPAGAQPCRRGSPRRPFPRRRWPDRRPTHRPGPILDFPAASSARRRRRLPRSNRMQRSSARQARRAPRRSARGRL